MFDLRRFAAPACLSASPNGVSEPAPASNTGSSAGSSVQPVAQPLRTARWNLRRNVAQTAALAILGATLFAVNPVTAADPAANAPAPAAAAGSTAIATLAGDLSLPAVIEKLPAAWSVRTNSGTRLQVPPPAVEADADAPGQMILNIGRNAMVTWRSTDEFALPLTLETRVRLYDTTAKLPTGSVVVRLGGQEINGVWTPTYSLRLSRMRASTAFTVQATLGTDDAWSHEAPPAGERQLTWGRPLYLQPRYTPGDISPLMPETMRREMERDFGALPDPTAHWVTLRLELKPTRVQMFADDLLIVDAPTSTPTPGTVELAITGMAQFAGMRVTSGSDASTTNATTTAADVTATSPVYAETPLTWLYRRPVKDPGGSAGYRTARTTVEGVPFTLTASAGQSSVDVGRSMFRNRLDKGYRPAAEPREIVPPAEEWDPASLNLRVPARAYRRAWVLATSSGDPATVPVLTLRFFKPGAGWWLDAATTVPAANATPEDAAKVAAKRVTVTDPLSGKPLAMWLVPIDLDAAALASDFREEAVLHLELTKQIHGFRAWPDPASYGYLPGGPPSGVTIHGLTLEEAPLEAYGTGLNHGNTHVYPDVPGWRIRLRAPGATPGSPAIPATVTLLVRSPSGHESTVSEAVAVAPGQQWTEVQMSLPQMEFGLYTVTTVVASGTWEQSRDATFLYLPPDRRTARGQTSPWGVWTWGGNHGTHADPDDNMRLLAAVGARNGVSFDARDRSRWGLGHEEYRIVPRTLPDWTNSATADPATVTAWQDELLQTARGVLKQHPDQRYFSMLAENSVSLRLTHDAPSYAFGDEWFTYDANERARIDSYKRAVTAAAQVLHPAFPKVNLVFGHCAPAFYLPFFREPDFDLSLFQGFGIDSPQFERMPERQPRATEPSLLYYLHKEMQDRGLKQEIIHLESYYPPGHPLGLGARGQADSTVRTALLSLSWGTTVFLNCWTLQDCADYWGSQHYGCGGLYSRRPEYNPKPAAAAFATMTQVLDGLQYVKALDVGSSSAFCLEFASQVRNNNTRVYGAWTVRGERPLTLTLDDAARSSADATDALPPQVIDENGNAKTLAIAADGTVQITLGATPQWLVLSRGALVGGAVGTPDYTHTDAPPAPAERRLVLEDFESRDWTAAEGEFPLFATNHWDVVRRAAAYTATRVPGEDGHTSTVLRLAPPPDLPANTPMVGYYRLFTPPAPIAIPGRASTIALHGRGGSAWNRVIYVLKDAQGETFMNIGNKDAWNCDDIHSWSSFNFDGWRYMTFPLPANAPGDDYREQDHVWWGSDGDHLVDLPLQLTGIIVEGRTNLIYADTERVNSPTAMTVDIDDISVEYASPADRTDAPVTLQTLARAAFQKSLPDSAELPNALATATADATVPGPVILDLYPPGEMRDGSRACVALQPVDGATEYQVWISAYEDGRGARAMAGRPVPDKPTDFEIRGLQPAVPLYFFATCTLADGRISKPSAARRAVLQDEFPMK